MRKYTEDLIQKKQLEKLRLRLEYGRGYRPKFLCSLIDEN